MIDIHCHILPEIDPDGPPTLDESLRMAQVAVSDGIKTIIATPHIQSVLHPPDDIIRRVDQLNRQLAIHRIPLKIIPGAEVNALLPLSVIAQYALLGHAVLIEFPHTFLPKNAHQIVYELAMRGLHPIIAHPERNGSITKRPSLAESIIEANGRLQITADSLEGKYGLEIQRCAHFLVKKKWVDFVATDAHSFDNRKPVMSQGARILQKLTGRDSADKILFKNPAYIFRQTASVK